MDEKNLPGQKGPRGRTSPFGDEFVRGPAIDSTRPLKGQPTANLEHEIQVRKDAIRQELDSVGHLTTLFAPPVAVLRVGIRVAELPPAPPDPLVPDGLLGRPCADCESEADPPPAWDLPADIVIGLSTEGIQLAKTIAAALVADPRIHQRAQVCVYQYEEAYNAFQAANSRLKEAEEAPLHQAWEILDAIGIERVKGKAYAICGFYENFKHDPVLGQLFPPPRLNDVAVPAIATRHPEGQTRPLQQRPAERQTRPLQALPPAPKAPPRSQGLVPESLLDAKGALLETTGGLLGKLRNLFNKS